MRNIILASLILMTCSTAFAVDKKIVDHLQSISVTVETADASGSGIIKVRKRGEENVSFVLTAAHVVKNLRKTKEVIDGKSGTKRTIVEFEDAKVVQVLVENGRTIGKVELYARVMKYNDEEDLAVLMVRKKNFSKETVEFMPANEISQIGTPVVHVGSFLGEKIGSASLSTGVISQLGRLINGKVFDQTSAAAFHGSSGGGVFLESNGKLIGMLLRGADPTFNFICPTRRIVTWTKSNNIEWLVNDAIALPSDDFLDKIIVEDNGVTFSANGAKMGPVPTSDEINIMIHPKKD